MCGDTLWQQNWLSKEGEDLSRAMVNLIHVSKADVYSGFADINGYNTLKDSKEITQALRIANLASTIKIIGQLAGG